jgi:hypothetical protein
MQWCFFGVLSLMGVGCLEDLIPPDNVCDATVAFMLPVTAIVGVGIFEIDASYRGHEICEEGNLCIEYDAPVGLKVTSVRPGDEWACGVSCQGTECGAQKVTCCIIKHPLPEGPLMPNSILIDVRAVAEGFGENRVFVLQGAEDFEDFDSGNDSAQALISFTPTN